MTAHEKLRYDYVNNTIDLARLKESMIQSLNEYLLSEGIEELELTSPIRFGETFIIYNYNAKDKTVKIHDTHSHFNPNTTTSVNIIDVYTDYLKSLVRNVVDKKYVSKTLTKK